MGGMVSQYLGINAPGRVASLTLVSTTSNMPREAGPIWDERIKDVKANGMAPQVEATIKALVHQRFSGHQCTRG